MKLGSALAVASLLLSIFIFAPSSWSLETSQTHMVSQQTADTDYGLLGFIERPTEAALTFVHRLTEHIVLSIIIMTLTLKALTFPLQYLAHRTSKKMQALQPEIKRIQENLAADAFEKSKAVQELFRRKKVNPLLGTVPIFLQIPIVISFFSLMNRIENFLGTDSFAWLHSLSAPDPLFILPILTGAILVLQQRYSPPQTTNKTPKWLKTMIPLGAACFSAFAPASVAIYILTSSAFQWVSQICLERLPLR